MRVFVYFNIAKRLYSIKALDGPAKGRVVAHATQVLLRDAEFRVSEAGRQRVIREGRKNVHAGVVGKTLLDFIGTTTGALDEIEAALPPMVGWSWGDALRCAKRHGDRVTYNPFKGPNFVTVEGARRATGAPMVYLECERMLPKVAKVARQRKAVFAFDPCATPETDAPCPDCGREIDGGWFRHCPDDTCPSNE